ncbi:PH domain-containing protein [Pseudonocardia thermophila]|uniref:PH domain-containing protein n=1 Tax=Pseudonocardia thermophila TaxID=1848 RepID=A0A1M6VD82_PSETH|nr:PH domain-containing protein [Pseudonocardia thermophila]
MDNFTVSDQGCSVCRWSPPPALVATLWIAAAAVGTWTAALALSGADAPGQLLGIVTASGLAVWAFWGTRARPRLLADPDGVTVRGFGAPHHHPWPLVQNVRIVRTRRFGLTSSLLEIDAVRADGTERLMLFGRLDLGADPEDVLPVLLAARPGG